MIITVQTKLLNMSALKLWLEPFFVPINTKKKKH